MHGIIFHCKIGETSINKSILLSFGSEKGIYSLAQVNEDTAVSLN